MHIFNNYKQFQHYTIMDKLTDDHFWTKLLAYVENITISVTLGERGQIIFYNEYIILF